MNDLVSEYQQYQDATAEGKFGVFFHFVYLCILFHFVEEGEGGEGEDEEHA
jgi:hypothetical protein